MSPSMSRQSRSPSFNIKQPANQDHATKLQKLQQDSHPCEINGATQFVIFHQASIKELLYARSSQHADKLFFLAEQALLSDQTLAAHL